MVLVPTHKRECHALRAQVEALEAQKHEDKGHIEQLNEVFNATQANFDEQVQVIARDARSLEAEIVVLMRDANDMRKSGDKQARLATELTHLRGHCHEVGARKSTRFILSLYIRELVNQWRWSEGSRWHGLLT